MTGVETYAIQTAAVSMEGDTVCKFGPSGYVKFTLTGGPLDGEQQLVEGTVNVIGANIVFNVPNYQTFASDGVTVIALGLQVTYVVVSQGPGPNVAAGDTWDTSWNLNFVPGSYLAPVRPPLLGVPPIITPSPTVWMAVTSGMTVNADNPSPGVWMYDTQADLDVDATTQTVGWSSVSMDSETTLIPTLVDWSTYVVPLEGDTSLTVTATTYTYAVFMGAAAGMTVVAS